MGDRYVVRDVDGVDVVVWVDTRGLLDREGIDADYSMVDYLVRSGEFVDQPYSGYIRIVLDE